MPAVTSHRLQPDPPSPFPSAIGAMHHAQLQPPLCNRRRPTVTAHRAKKLKTNDWWIGFLESAMFQKRGAVQRCIHFDVCVRPSLQMCLRVHVCRSIPCIVRFFFRLILSYHSAPILVAPDRLRPPLYRFSPSTDFFLFAAKFIYCLIFPAIFSNICHCKYKYIVGFPIYVLLVIEILTSIFCLSI